jgi:hypothetical protein
MIGTDTLPIPELKRLRGISDELGRARGVPRGRRGRRRGTAAAGGCADRGDQQERVRWYRYRIDRQYERVDYRDGKYRRTKHTEKVAEFTSSEGCELFGGL